MKIVKNKFFILGNVLLILISIPITLFFIKQQQDLRSQAAPSSTLYVAPENPSTTTACPDFTVDVMLDPGQNVVSIVDLHLTYDSSFLELTQISPNTTAFPTVVRDGSINSGSANVSVSVGPNVTSAIQTITKVATLTFRPLQATTGTASVITINSAQSRVFSLAPEDQPTENVLSTTRPGNVTITQSTTCPSDGGGPITPGISPTIPLSPITPTPTGGTGGINPTPTTSQIPTPTIITETTITPSPTSPVNQAPVCVSFEVSPQATGSAPFSVLFTAQGNDPDGLISKATFNFGDSTVMDLTDGLNTQDVTIQQSHTYQGGTFSATLVFTDDRGSISNTCSQVISVDGESTASPSATPTSAIQPTSTFTPTPTISDPGGILSTIGIIGGVVLVVLIGAFLMAL